LNQTVSCTTVFGGGGPANEHNYAAGLRMHWLMTGDRLSREAAIGLATWVINMDDGRKTVLRWLAPSYTGLASATQSPDFHGPGRGAGHSVMALIEGTAFTGDRRHRRRPTVDGAAHPADDIDALNVRCGAALVVHRVPPGRWQVPGLQGRTRRSGRVAYHAAQRLHYARWMAQRRRAVPTVARSRDHRSGRAGRASPTCLPLPRSTPTRPSDRFTDRARFFFDYSMTTLLGETTRAFARPVVLFSPTGGWSSTPGDLRSAQTPGRGDGVDRRRDSSRRRPRETAVARAGRLAAAIVLAIALTCLAGWL
jgi:hypothetical protein